MMSFIWFLAGVVGGAIGMGFFKACTEAIASDRERLIAECVHREVEGLMPRIDERIEAHLKNANKQ